MSDYRAVHQPEDFAARRRRLLARLESENAALILPGGQHRVRSNDTEYPFRPDSDFYYLTGLCEPDAVMLLAPNREHALTLFVRPRDPVAETWSGRRVGPEGAKEKFAADEAFAIQELRTKLATLIEGFDRIYVPLTEANPLENQLRRSCNELRRQNRDGKQAPWQFADARELMGSERLVKDRAGLACLRYAVDLSAKAHVAAMQATRGGVYEFELEALIAYECRRRGSTGVGYGSIVAGGDNATILHYVENNARLRDGDIVLIDAGAEWEFFSGDITRSFPVNGTFSPAQRDLYEIVLQSNLKGIEMCRIGNTIDDIHAACVRILAQGLADLKLCDGSVDEIIADASYKKYYMHRTNHWLGLDVHDLGPYASEGERTKLQENMVLTVEPALYIAHDDERAPADLRGTGIRIEDDILIQKSGPENLSHAAPKRIADIEALMQR